MGLGVGEGTGIRGKGKGEDVWGRGQGDRGAKPGTLHILIPAPGSAARLPRLSRGARRRAADHRQRVVSPAVMKTSQAALRYRLPRP